MAECAIPDCQKPARTMGWCSAHYERYRKHGDPLRGGPLQRQSTPADGRCTVPGCTRRHDAHGWCQMHRLRWKKYGELDPPHGNLKDDPTYSAIHERLRLWHGPAAQHPCVDCGEIAREWSYMGGAPDERLDDLTGCVYSRLLEFYEPRCKRCHIAYDDVPARAWEKRRSI